MPPAGAVSAIRSSILDPMRRSGLGWIVAFGVGLATLGLAGSPASAQPKADSDRVDIDAVKPKLVVLSDGKGHYLVVLPKVGEDHTYYGDGKTMYAQRIISGGSDGKGGFEVSYWSPRSRPYSRGELERKNGVWRVTCDKRDSVFSKVPTAEARKVLDTAQFRKPLWRHSAYALARDSHGTYYYVDRLRDPYGGRGFRLWVGQRGNMKKQRMLNIVSDSEGDIFATKAGDLRLILDKKDATWVRGKKRRELTYVPVSSNVYMIYAELGVYVERLGTPCDDI